MLEEVLLVLFEHRLVGDVQDKVSRGCLVLLRCMVAMILFACVKGG